MDGFIRNTIDPGLFYICDVLNDNACFYRAIGNYMWHACPSQSMNSVKRFYNWGRVKNISDCLGKYCPTQDELARFIQKKIVKYIQQNPDLILSQTGMSIYDSINMIHDITFEEYLEHYKLFAGDVECYTDSDTEECYIDRWGSIIEQVVISNIIKCPVIVFNTQKYDTRFNKISNGKITNGTAHPGVRLKLSAVIGQEFISHKLPIFLIWREYNNSGHYMACYPKDPNSIVSKLSIIT